MRHRCIWEPAYIEGGGRCVRYILVCHDVFSRYIKLYPLKSATTKACLNRLINKYFGDVIKPRCILSDNATQFRSPSWSRQLQQQGVGILFAPIRHPESKPSERCMRELSKFYSIYCNGSHRKWAELLPRIEKWMNDSVCSSTGYPLSYGVPVRERYGSTLLPATREQHDQNCTQSH